MTDELQPLRDAAKTIADRIPGTTATVMDCEVWGLALQVDYACPCGRDSHLRQCYRRDRVPPAHYIVDAITHMLRTHVRAEGSEPQF